MTAIKPLSQIASKWQKNSAGASDEYRQGVQNPRRDWEQATLAADDARKAGLDAAEARGAFLSGVRDAGTEKWQSRSIKFGPARYRQGVQGSEREYSEGFNKFHSVIQSVNLPPRGPKGSPENLERVRAITEALHDAKISG